MVTAQEIASANESSIVDHAQQSIRDERDELMPPMPQVIASNLPKSDSSRVKLLEHQLLEHSHVVEQAHHLFLQLQEQNVRLKQVLAEAHEHQDMLQAQLTSQTVLFQNTLQDYLRTQQEQGCT